MITLRDTTILAVAALMLSAVQSFANETCAANVNDCTPLQLCEASTSIVNGQKVWSTDLAYADHVSTSQRLGINCGVVEVVQPTCETDANLCTVTALCEQATQISASGTSRSWSAENVEHARLARQFGLTCGVGETVASQASNATADEEFCSRTTFALDGALTWRHGSMRTEAERRGLTCGVGEAVAAQLTLPVDDQELCARATFEYDERVRWRGGRLRREAEERGLNCGVGRRADENAMLGWPSASNDDQVCTRATHEYQGRVMWRGTASSAPWRYEAEERGLTCGVGETAAAQPSVALDDEALCARATFVYDERITWRGGLLRRQAEERGLTCGVGEQAAKQSNAIGDEKLCPSSGYFHECFGTYTNEDGDQYIGSWFADKLYGVATAVFGPGEWEGDVRIGKINSDGFIVGDQVLYIWSSGHARFEWSWPRGQSYSSNSNVNDVFPSLTRMFENLPREQRIAIQRSLARKGLYDSTLDGLWGRNTLISIARFTGEHLNTVNLRSTENVIIVLDAIRAQAGLDRTAKASSDVLQAVTDRDAVAAAATTNSVNYRQAFTSQTLLRRQQLQYALRELGFYSSNVDGLWGNGTSSAIVSFVEANGGTGRDSDRIFRDILSRVNVPNSFAAPRQNNQAGANSNSAGLTAIIGRPTLSGVEAMAVCRPQASNAEQQARNGYREPSYGYSANCFGSGNNFRCSGSETSGGFWGGFAAEMGRSQQGRSAYNATLASCLAQYGWRR